MNITAFDVLKGIIATCGFCLVLTCSSFGATFTVTKTADTNDGVCDADCSLREAIGAANQATSNDVIQFDAAVFSTPKTITLNGTELDVADFSGDLTVN